VSTLALPPPWSGEQVVILAFLLSMAKERMSIQKMQLIIMSSWRLSWESKPLDKLFFEQ
jgi:hypothetical protein